MHRSIIIRTIYVACLMGATFNHARTLLRHGLSWDYGGFSAVSAVYWTSLTFIDPIVAGLLFVRPRVGVVGVVVLISTNVLHNLVITAQYAPAGAFLKWVLASWMLISQMGFLLFVLGTARMAWGGSGDSGDVSRT